MAVNDREIIDHVIGRWLHELRNANSIVKLTTISLIASLREAHKENLTIEGVVNALKRLSQFALEVSDELNGAKGSSQEDRLRE